MIGFHLQGNVNEWPRAVRHLPKGAPVKFVDGIQRAREAKAVNPGVYTVVRHHVSQQALPAGSYTQMKLAARQFFESFVDESFLKEAPYIDAVQEWNEYFANSQNSLERSQWIMWAEACADVWAEYRATIPVLKNMDLILAEAAVGNDIPLGLAKLSHDNHWIHLGYHPYVPVWMGEIRPDAWRWYSGRWAYMDDHYRNSGYTRVTWFFGEFGAVGHTAPGWPNSLAPLDGWKHSNVYNGNLNGYLKMMGDWMTKVGQTRAWKEGRVIGATIFTSGGGSLWRHFELAMPDMQDVAIFVSATQPPRPDNPQPPPPPPAPSDGEPRVQYAREYWVLPQDTPLSEYLELAELAYGARRTIGFSYDDAGIGNLDNKRARLFNIPTAQHQEFRDWYSKWYPGTIVEFYDNRPSVTMPVDQWTVTQRFGDNYEEYMSRFGIPGHNGIDFGLQHGSNVLAVADGVVHEVGYKKNGYGNYIILKHNDVLTLYGHLATATRVQGESVKQGEVIAYSGNSGYSTGPHLHFEVRVNGVAVDPETYLGKVERRG